MIRLVTPVLLLLASANVWAGETPRKALAEFLRFELEGGRLTGERWAEYLSTYINAPADYDEPGWDMATIVSSYQVGMFKCRSDVQCTCSVRFALAPTRSISNQNIASHPQGGREQVKYTITKTHRGWRVEPDFGAPRISTRTYRLQLAKPQ